MKHLLYFALAVLVFSCRGTDNPVANKAPETTLQVDSIVRSGDLRLGTNVTLHWYGMDVDGFINGYHITVDETSSFTSSTDSTFSFSIEAGQDTTDILLTVAAEDNEGLIDPSPATLIVPIKNAAPEVAIDPDGLLSDSAFIVATVDWRATDDDGDETIESVEFKLNAGNWVEIGTSISLLSFATDPQGNVAYYKNAGFIDSISGADLQGENFIFLRARDRAGVYSEIDTTAGFYWKAANSATLIINGQPEYIGSTYKEWMDSANVDYDYLQMDAVSGAGIPAYWDPTFEIIMSSYSKIALFTDATVFPTKSGDDYLLNILALSTQKFLQKGGKLFTASQFSSNMAGGAFLDIFPLESLVFSSGQARLTNDSTLAPLQPGFPSLQPQNIVLGITPIVPSADATALYNGQITKIAGWNGATTMGATRTQNGSINQVFVALPLHVFNRPTNHGGILLDHVFNAVF
jgi:hypothetical protein